MEAKVIRSEDIGNGWSAEFWSDGSLTLRDADGFDAIWLDAEEAKRLAAIFREADSLAA